VSETLEGPRVRRIAIKRSNWTSVRRRHSRSRTLEGRRHLVARSDFSVCSSRGKLAIIARGPPPVIGPIGLETGGFMCHYVRVTCAKERAGEKERQRQTDRQRERERERERETDGESERERSSNVSASERDPGSFRFNFVGPLALTSSFPLPPSHPLSLSLSLSLSVCRWSEQESTGRWLRCPVIIPEIIGI